MQTKTQKQHEKEARDYQAERLARFGEFTDPQEDMRQAVDALLMVLINDSSERDVTDALLVFLHQLACQEIVTAIDCLQWAAARCYHWTNNCSAAQDNYVASILQERKAWAAQNSVG